MLNHKLTHHYKTTSRISISQRNDRRQAVKGSLPGGLMKVRLLKCLQLCTYLIPALDMKNKSKLRNEVVRNLFFIFVDHFHPAPYELRGLTSQLRIY